MDGIYKNVKECNPNKKRKILIVLGDMIADMFNNKKFNSVVTELFITAKELNFSLVFILKSHFTVPKKN